MQNLLDKINYPKDLKKLNIQQLKQICDEIRTELIQIVSQAGGHLGAGLGVVELTVALHYVFDTPQDKIVWDIGHQAYPHKMITGRRKQMKSIRQKGGLSGFCSRSESEFDVFGAGHSSTSISAGIGIEIANRILDEEKNNIVTKTENRKLNETENNIKTKTKVVTVIGDSACTAGMAYEALNNVGYINNRMIVILNDNDMSIAKSTGALNKYLTNMTSSYRYRYLKSVVKNFCAKLPMLLKILRKTKIITKSLIEQDSFFSSLGLNYVGVIDGHDIETLIKVLNNIKNLQSKRQDDKAILLHIKTKKGYGYKPAENSEDCFHGVSKFDIATGKPYTQNTENINYSKVFGNYLTKLAHKDNKITAIVAAMTVGTGLQQFKQKFSDRFFDVGISEQHAVTFAAGMSTQKLKPFVAIYSTFLQRAYDQIIHDVAVQNLPVKFAIDRAGLVGPDGATHAGSFDIAYLSIIPNFVVMCPSTPNELIAMMNFAVQYDKGPIAFRYPRDNFNQKLVDYHNKEKITLGKAKIIQKGENIAILSIGTRLEDVKQAVKLYQNEIGEKQVTIVDARFVKPIDEKLIVQLIKQHKMLVTVEEGSVGGFATQVTQCLIKYDLLNQIRIKNLFLPDKFQSHGAVDELRKEAEIDSDTILKLLLEENKKN